MLLSFLSNWLSTSFSSLPASFSSALTALSAFFRLFSPSAVNFMPILFAILSPPFLDEPGNEDLVDEVLALRLGHAVVLPEALPLVEELPDRHQPDLALRSSQQGHSDEDQPGEVLAVKVRPFAPAAQFFEPNSSSLSTRRCESILIASTHAIVRSGSSAGVVSISTASAVSSGSLV